MTCENCLHYEICNEKTMYNFPFKGLPFQFQIQHYIYGVEERCKHFKENSYFEAESEIVKGEKSNITNYEYIKNMSIEEMAHVFAKMITRTVKEIYPNFTFVDNKAIEEQYKNCFEWLTKSVE